MPESVHLPLVELGPLGREGLGRMMGEGEIHVVAAQKDVIADGDARQHELPRFFADGDQREVRRAAADIAN